MELSTKQENLVKFGHVIPEICMQTGKESGKHTYRQTVIIQGESKNNPLILLDIFQLVVILSRRTFTQLFNIHIFIYVPILVHLSQYL